MTDLLATVLPSAASYFDAKAPPALLPYQQRWAADNSQLKIAEKSRRVGLTWAEASDNVLNASKERRAGGRNTYYIGYNMDMAIEYIEACAMWARVFSQAVSTIEEGEEIFKQDNEDKAIKTYTIRFASGFRIVALSSRPANLRGKQGDVVIDEAAFHGQLEELVKAALALLIWGDRVRIISTHNGDQNEFNELINEIRAGKRKGSVHRITFKEAVAEGLFRRVCLRKGVDWDQAAEDVWVADVYKFYGDASEEELDVIPSQGSGAWLTSSLIEARMTDTPVLRFNCAKGFERRPDYDRKEAVQEWLDFEVRPLLAKLDPKLPSVFGQDFGRSGDLTVQVPAQILQNLQRHAPFILELRNMPHREQEQVAKFVIGNLPMFSKGAVDARGNGHALSEFLAQHFGWNRIELVMLSESWYREQMPPLKSAFEDGLISLPRDKDILQDLRAIKMVKGIARVPDGRSTGKDGGQRHGDAGIAIAMMHYASRNLANEIDFQSADARSSLGAFDGHAMREIDHAFGTVSGNNDFQGFV